MTSSINALLFAFCCAAMTGDAVTTVIGMRRGWKETNQLMPQQPAGVLALLGSLLLVAMLLWIASDRTGDVWLAMSTLGVLGVIKLYCAVKNAVRLWGH